MTSRIACIGSREVPFDISLLMYDIGAKFGSKYIIRSGGAKGSDIHFENGCRSISTNLKPEIFRANDATEESIKFSLPFHPTPHKIVDSYIRKLMGRNSIIILGKDLKTPVARVVCYCKEENGIFFGGTGQGCRIAKSLGIPIMNLYFEEVRKKFREVLYD